MSYADHEWDNVRDCLEGAVAEAEQRDERVRRFAHAVKDMPSGPLGELLRTIAFAHADWAVAEQAGGSTAGEETRIGQILDAAMDAADYLRGMGL